MLCSSNCHLKGLSEDNMVQAGEERLERGGYFICKGSEKVVRLLVGNKRNFPLALVRPSSKEKGKMFTEFSGMLNQRDTTLKFIFSYDALFPRRSLGFNYELALFGQRFHGFDDSGLSYFYYIGSIQLFFSIDARYSTFH